MVPPRHLDRDALPPHGYRRRGNLSAELVRYGREYGREGVWTVYAEGCAWEESGGECGCVCGGRCDGVVVLGMVGPEVSGGVWGRD